MEVVSDSSLKVSEMLVLCIAPILNRPSLVPVFILGKNETLKFCVFQQRQHCFRYYYWYSKTLFLFLIWMHLKRYTMTGWKHNASAYRVARGTSDVWKKIEMGINSNWSWWLSIAGFKLINTTENGVLVDAVQTLIRRFFFFTFKISLSTYDISVNVITRVHKTAKATISFTVSVLPSVRPHGTTQPPLYGFSLNLICVIFLEISREYSTLINPLKKKRICFI
jgi:hypothetical protein